MFGIFRQRGVKGRGVEAGQVLPLTLAALLLGILVATPFLSQAGTSLIGSRSYGLIINEGYAADAGVEHAIWRLMDDGLEALLPTVGSTVNYSLPNQVNSLTPSIAVQKTGEVVTPAGTIGDAALDTLEFDPSEGSTPRLVHVSGDVYAIVYSGPGSDGFIKTVTVSASGQIADVVIDTLEFDPGTGLEPRIINVSGSVYAVVYRGVASDGFIKTVTIAANGQITDVVIDTLEYDTADGFEPDIIHVSGDVYAVVYRGVADDGFMKTVSIAANGLITDAVIDTLEFDTSNCFTPKIIHISGDVYGVAYRGVASDGFMKTVTIAANGLITDVVIDTLEYDTADGFEPDIIHVSGDVYAVAYRGVADDGFIKTVTIAANGQIADVVIDTLEFDPVDCLEPSITRIAGDVYAVAYRGQSSDGFIKTVTIAANGQITDAVIDTLEFDPVDGAEPHLVQIASGVYAIVYRGDNSDGFLITISITEALHVVATYSVASVAGGATTSAVVVMTDGVPAVNTWAVQR